MASSSSSASTGESPLFSTAASTQLQALMRKFYAGSSNHEPTSEEKKAMRKTLRHVTPMQNQRIDNSVKLAMDAFNNSQKARTKLQEQARKDRLKAEQLMFRAQAVESIMPLAAPITNNDTMASLNHLANLLNEGNGDEDMAPEPERKEEKKARGRPRRNPVQSSSSSSSASAATPPQAQPSASQSQPAASQPTLAQAIGNLVGSCSVAFTDEMRSQRLIDYKDNTDFVSCAAGCGGSVADSKINACEMVCWPRRVQGDCGHLMHSVCCAKHLLHSHERPVFVDNRSVRHALCPLCRKIWVEFTSNNGFAFPPAQA